MWTRSAALGLLAFAAAAALAAQTRGLPPGPAQEKVRIACLPCHDARIILQQRLNRQGWEKSVDKMIRWGTPVAPGDRDIIIEYLVRHFGPEGRSVGRVALPAAAGAEKVRAACLGCHDVDLIAQERQDRRGWSSLLDKMVRWGAEVRREDREAILTFLVTHYGPARR